MPPTSAPGAAPPEGSGLASSAPVPFAVRFGTRSPVDSARVDLVLTRP
jgi:hypothetical protein